MRRQLILLLVLSLVLDSASRSLAQALVSAGRPPKLIVLLVVDQMRGDYIERFGRQWTGGLRRLTSAGARFSQADYPYFNTVTCAGHATISTGALPAVHGMILNSWWDRTLSKVVTCTEDPDSRLVSYGKAIAAPGDSAERLRVPTLADELRQQLSPAGRVLAFSLKARSAISMGGHRPDVVVWFDDGGTWVTSTAFSGSPIPAVAEFVKRHPVEDEFGAIWNRALPASAYLYETPTVGIAPPAGQTSAFPHRLRGESSSPDQTFYDRWQGSPNSDAYLARMALEVATEIKIGTAPTTSLMAIGFSALDRVGHDFGPDSHEVQDLLIRLDRTLDELFKGLDRLVGRNNYTVALTADHGVAPVPERTRQFGIPAGRISSSAIVGSIERALVGAFGPGRYVNRLIVPDLYLEPGVADRLRQQPQAMAGLRTAMRSVAGIERLYTSDELEANQFADDTIGRALSRSHFPGRSGDLAIVLSPNWLTTTAGTSHGTGYRYDTRVPLMLMGPNIVPGEYLTPASPIDVAPTLAYLAGVTLPNAQGRVLVDALSPALRGASK